jgi:hypothetical protein
MNGVLWQITKKYDNKGFGNALYIKGNILINDTFCNLVTVFLWLNGVVWINNCTFFMEVHLSEVVVGWSLFLFC